MIITIQPLKKGYAIIVTDIYTFPDLSQFDVTKEASKLAEVMFEQTGERPAIKMLPIIHTPMATKKAVKKTVAKKAAQDKIKLFRKEDIEKYNPYQATTLPTLGDLKSFWDQVRYQVWAQVRDQVRAQVGAQVWDQVGDQVWDQVRAQVGAQVWDQVGDQVGAQVWAQVGDQVGAQVWDQVGATSYWGVKVALDLPIKHWFFDFLKLGVMIIFVKGKIKVFGKKGTYLGEYDEKDFTSRKE